MSISDEIRNYGTDNFVAHARNEGLSELEVPVREIHEALGLNNRYPQVISALKASTFLNDNALEYLGHSGPVESTTTVLKFKLLNTISSNEPNKAPRVFIANFGFRNNIWESCLKGNNIATMNDVDTQPFWEAGDRDGFVDYCIANKRATSGKPIGRSTASRWYNLMTIISESSNDIWIHRAGDDLWWTETTNDPFSIALETDPDPNPGFPEFYVCRKPCNPWRNTDVNGKRLLWQSLHPKARYFLHTEATLQQLRGENPAYSYALINGQKLDKWHSRAAWKDELKKSKNGMVGQRTAKSLSFESMFYNADAATRQSGKKRVSIAKDKKFLFKDREEFFEFLEQQYQDQDGLCALTNISLEFQYPDADKQLLCSLDRIDSNGHYEASNLQIVCRFANFWKSDRDNDEFQRLISIVKSTL